VSSWQHIEQRLTERVRELSAQEHAAQREFAYREWAAGAVLQCIEDLERGLYSRVAVLGPTLRQTLDIRRLQPSRAEGVQHVVCLGIGGDEVHLHGQWLPGMAPTVYLLWSRKRNNRYCQMVSVAGGWLVPRGNLTGYQLRPQDDPSGNEITTEQLLLRAFELLTIGSR
jgi:hypothetical protein